MCPGHNVPLVNPGKIVSKNGAVPDVRKRRATVWLALVDQAMVARGGRCVGTCAVSCMQELPWAKLYRHDVTDTHRGAQALRTGGVSVDESRIGGW